MLEEGMGSGEAGPAMQNRGVQAVRGSSASGKFPVGEMGCKDQRRFAVESKLRKQFVGARPDFDPAILGARGIVLPDMIEVREFGADATEIVPDACENGLDLGRRFLRKCGGQIGATELFLPQPGPEPRGD